MLGYAAEEVAAAHHDRDFDSQTMYVGDFGGDLVHTGIIHPKALAGGQRLAGEFQQNAFIDWSVHVLETLEIKLQIQFSRVATGENGRGRRYERTQAIPSWECKPQYAGVSSLLALLLGDCDTVDWECLSRTASMTCCSESSGSANFRPYQREIIQDVLKGNDVVCVMPTGAGKSLCFQLPALMLKGLTVVVSPLISLMADQVRHLQTLGFLCFC